MKWCRRFRIFKFDLVFCVRRFIQILSFVLDGFWRNTHNFDGFFPSSTSMFSQSFIQQSNITGMRVDESNKNEKNWNRNEYPLMQVRIYYLLLLSFDGSESIFNNRLIYFRFIKLFLNDKSIIAGTYTRTQPIRWSFTCCLALCRMPWLPIALRIVITSQFDQQE